MENERQVNNNRMVLLLIAGIPLTMILAATWLWYFVVRGDLDLVSTLGTANRGSLLQPPRQIDDSDLVEESGYPFKYLDLDPKWTMLVPSSGGRCTSDCERSLSLTRQIHVAMGKEFSRLRRLYVGDAKVAETPMVADTAADRKPAGALLGEWLSSEHRGIRTAVATPATLQTLFEEYQEDTTTWYLVDPAGWIMMSYNGEVDYKDVIADLKFLLKNSSE